MEPSPDRNAADVVKIIHFKTIDSTNLEISRMAQAGSVDPWTVIVADHQSAGRGRQGRDWNSDEGAGLWASVLVQLDGCPEPGWLPLITGLSVVSTLSQFTTAHIGVKWPNDILVADRKLAGILIEALPTSDQYIVGIGINFESNLYPGAIGLKEIAVSGLAIDRDRILVDLMQELQQRILQWRSQNWDTELLRESYLRECISIGAELQITEPRGVSWTGIGVGVTPSGHLLVRETGTTLERTVIAADVVHASIAPCTPKNS